MKKLWFQNLALTIGLLGAASAYAQYPNQFNAAGPSSYPLQAPMNFQPLPQVPVYQPQPQQSPFQLTRAQEQVVAGEYVDPIPNTTYNSGQYQPAPQPAHQPVMAAPGGYVQDQSGCQSCGQSNMAPSMEYNYGYAQSVAPNCTSCGPAPVSQQYYAGMPSSCGSGACGVPAMGSCFGSGMGLGGLPMGAKPWFFGGGVLLFNRVDDYNRTLAFRDADAMPVLRTGDAQMGVSTGFEVMAGRYFNCGKNAIVASYWGIFPETQMARADEGAGAFRSSFIGQDDVWIDVNPTGAAMPNFDVYDWIDGARLLRLDRSSEYHNIEVNLLGFGVGCASRNFSYSTAGTMFSGTRSHGGYGGCGYCGGAGCGACGGGAACGSCAPCAPSKFATGPCGYVAPACGSRLNLSWLAGIRWFRFEDNLNFAASFTDSAITRAVDDMYYDVNAKNDLVGFQLGSRADYCLGSRFNLYGNGKVGLYGNHSSVRSRIGTDTVNAYEAFMPTMPYVTDSSKTEVAFLSELGSGVGIRVSPKWTATVGYRAVIASGVATAVGNTRYSRDLLRDQRNIDNHDTLILHGVNIGALYNF